MKISEVFKNVGLFEAFESEHLELPVTVDSELLDLMYLGHSGEKITSPLCNIVIQDLPTTERIYKLARIIYAKCSDNWQRIYDALTSEYELLDNYDGTETSTHTITHTGTQSVQNTGTQSNQNTGTQSVQNSNAHNVSGFNSVSPVSDNTDSGTTTQTNNLTNTQTNNLTNTQTKNLTDTDTFELHKHGNLGVTSSQQMINQELELRIQNNFLEILFNTIDKTIALDVY